MSHRFAVVYEADADLRTATELTDRVFLEAIDWLEEKQLIDYREWIGEVGQERLMWKTIPRLAREARIRSHGHIDGSPLEADAAAARRAILYLKATFDDLDGIMLIRDQDDQPERSLGLEQARSEHRAAPPVVLGLAIVEREAWVLAGFEPRDDDERARLESERERLGYYPQQQSHRLNACKDDDAKHSPKRVLKELSGSDYERERRCWNKTSLSVLRQHGDENGLSAFLEEVRAQFASLLGYVPYQNDH